MTKVYAVIGGWDYEGESFDSLRLFDCFSTADAYLKHLTENDGTDIPRYDYAKMDTREVCMESALLTTA
jgi:hypothetical protein